MTASPHPRPARRNSLALAALVCAWTLLAGAGSALGKEPLAELVAALDSPNAEAARRAAETILADYRTVPEVGEAAELLGHYHYARGEYLTAAKQFERAAAAAPSESERTARQLLRGRALLGAREGSLAARVYESVLKGDPTSAEARLGLADALFLDGKAERAADIYRELSADGPDEPLTPLALAQLVRASDQLGRPADARAAARKLATEYPHSSEAAVARDRLRREAEATQVAPGSGDRGGAAPGAERSPPGVSAVASAPSSAADSSSGRYSLQLGAFGEEANAQELRLRLEQWGITAVRIEEERRGERLYYRVRAGYYPDAQAAEDAGSSLRDAHGLSYRVVEN